MNRRALLSTILMSGLILVGCGTETDNSGSQRLRNPGGVQIRTVNLDDLTYEEISGTINPGESGLMGAYLTTWDRNCFFGINVPADAVPPNWGPVNFVMRVPTKASYLAYPDLCGLIVRLEPSGPNFQVPITVVGTWMPWKGAPPADIHEYVGEEIYGTPTVEYLSNINRYRITFECSHFSDWDIKPPICCG